MKNNIRKHYQPLIFEQSGEYQGKQIKRSPVISFIHSMGYQFSMKNNIRKHYQPLVFEQSGEYQSKHIKRSQVIFFINSMGYQSSMRNNKVENTKPGSGISKDHR